MTRRAWRNVVLAAACLALALLALSCDGPGTPTTTTPSGGGSGSGNTIAGTVRGADGAAVAVGSVVAYNAGTCVAAGSADIQADGSYRIEGLPDGAYDVAAVSARFPTQFASASMNVGQADRDTYATRTASRDFTMTGQIPYGTFFHCEGRHIVADSTSQKVCFRGICDPGLAYGFLRMPDTAYPGTEGIDYFKPDSQDYDKFARWGFSLVRVAFEWRRALPDGFQVGDTVTELNAYYVGMLDDAVRYARERGLYVLLEMHNFYLYWAGLDDYRVVNQNAQLQQLLVDTWRLLAARYADETAVLGYEIMNEPFTDGDADWHTAAQAVIDSIRSVDANHLIFVDGRHHSNAHLWPRPGTPEVDSNDYGNGPTPFVTDPRPVWPGIVYCPHLYLDAYNEGVYSGEDDPPEGWRQRVVDRTLACLYWGADNNVPIAFTETGIPNSQTWADALHELFERYMDPTCTTTCAWEYEPEHSKSGVSLLDDGVQLPVLMAHQTGVYDAPGSLSARNAHVLVAESMTAEDAFWHVQDPWLITSWDAVVSRSAAPTGDVGAGQVSVRAEVTAPWGGIGFYHHWLDLRDYTHLVFLVRSDPTAPAASLFLRLKSGSHAVLNQVNLEQYLAGGTWDTWRQVEIPLADLLSAGSSDVTGLLIQTSQPGAFLLDDVSFVRK